MSKKVLALSASPRRCGNSDLLCDRLLQGAQEAGHQTEKIFLGEKKVGVCTACDYCRSHNGQCAQKDDMAEILDKMVKADVLVLASPVYFYSINAQMKAVIDRTVARYLELTGKELCYIIAAAEDDRPAMERAVECFRGFADCLPDPEERGVIYGIGVWQKGEIQDKPAMEEAYQLGRSL